jgi:hypothetical protein
MIDEIFDKGMKLSQATVSLSRSDHPQNEGNHLELESSSLGNQIVPLK